MYILTRAELLFTLCYEIPCNSKLMYIKYQILITSPYLALSSRAKHNETENEKSANECKLGNEREEN